MYDVQMNYEYY